MAHGIPRETHSSCRTSWDSISLPCDTMVSRIPDNQVEHATDRSGMGNRFREMSGYHSLIRAHGVIAAIVFLFIVPAAILTLRFHSRNTRRAIHIHIWLQILTVLLTTVIFVLGWFAVGPERSLTNPHHGIGLAIYVLVLAQTIGGWWVNRKERKRRTLYTPLTAMVSSTYLSAEKGSAKL